jgi:alpha-galactosidase
LPIVKKLGFRWVILDDGWQTAEGDWFLNPENFPVATAT